MCRVSDTDIEEGDKVTYSVYIDGGDSPFEIKWKGDISGDDTVERVRYNRKGTYEVSVMVTDDHGRMASDDCADVDVDDDDRPNNPNDDLEVICRVSDTSIDEGDVVTYTVEIDGGDSPYDIDWRGDISGDDRRERVRYNREGRYEVYVVVEDDDGNRDSDDCSTVRVDDDHDNNNDDDDDRNVNVFASTNLSTPTGQLASLESVFLSQVPYTGPEDVAKVAGIIALALLWSMGIAMWLKKRRSVNSVSNKIEEFKRRNKEATIIS